MPDSHSDNWTPCSGELTGLANVLQRKRRRALSQKAVVASAFALILIVGAVFGMQDGKPPIRDFGPKGGLSCRDCVNKYEDYAAGRLDEEMEVRMSHHLEACPSCKRHLEPNGGRNSTRLDRPRATQVSLVANVGLSAR